MNTVKAGERINKDTKNMKQIEVIHPKGGSLENGKHIL